MQDNNAPDCSDCGIEMTFCDEEKTDELLETDFYDNYQFIFWTEDETSQADFYHCEECAIVRLCCKKCKIPMKIVKHAGICISGEQFFTRKGKIGTTKMTKHRDPKNKKALYDVSDMDNKKIRINEWFVSGPNNEHRHEWFCLPCNKLVVFN